MKPDHYYHQSGVIAYRRGSDGFQVLLVTSRKGKRWIIPKGVIEPDLGASQSAAKEAFEEAGVVGRISKASIGSFRYEKWGGTCECFVFLLEIEELVDEWQEAWFRKRAFYDVADAMGLVRESELKQIIAAVPGLVELSAQ